MATANGEKSSPDARDPRVLSIQSHVVHGYCGNKSAVFPLQTLGFEVDFVNSVQFSNHTGYLQGWTGHVLHDGELLELFQGLKKNALDKAYTHILTGYARSPTFLAAISNVIDEVKQNSPDAIYLCDPVLGDHGQLYVPEELVAIYRDKIVPLADIIKPNQFETELLTDMKITDFPSALAAIDKLHSKGPHTVVISSLDFDTGDGEDRLVSIGSSRVGGKRQLYKITFDRVDANFIGTGDLFAALFLAWFTKSKADLKLTMQYVVATLQAIIQRTFHHAQRQPGGPKSWANIELKLIQGRADIIEPKVQIEAEQMAV